MAHRDQTLSPADRDRVRTQGDRHRPIRQDRRKPQPIRWKTLRRFLHPGRRTRHRGLRRRALHRGHSRDRHARAYARGAGFLSPAGMPGQGLRGMDPLGDFQGRALRRKGGDLRIRGKRARRGARPVPLEIHTRRGRRMSQGALEGVPRLPEAHPGGGTGKRKRTSELFHAPRRKVAPRARTRVDRMGRDHAGRNIEVSGNHGLDGSVPGNGRREEGKPSHHDSTTRRLPIPRSTSR